MPLLKLQQTPVLRAATKTRQTRRAGVGQQVVHPRRPPCHSPGAEAQIPGTAKTRPLLPPSSLGPPLRGSPQVILESCRGNTSVCLNAIFALRAVVNIETDVALSGTLHTPHASQMGYRFCHPSLVVTQHATPLTTHQQPHDKVCANTAPMI